MFRFLCNGFVLLLLLVFHLNYRTPIEPGEHQRLTLIVAHPISSLDHLAFLGGISWLNLEIFSPCSSYSSTVLAPNSHYTSITYSRQHQPCLVRPPDYCLRGPGNLPRIETWSASTCKPIAGQNREPFLFSSRLYVDELPRCSFGTNCFVHRLYLCR